MKKNNIIVEVDCPIEGTSVAIGIINKFLKINNIKIKKLSIAYDYEYDGYGIYYPYLIGQKYRIFINPLNCIDIGNENEDDNDPVYPGYCADLSIFGITIHEFTHLLQYKVYPNLISEYNKTFPIERFYLNNYSNNEIHDEIAEVMTLYITNPYLLKLLSKNHFNFCKKFFKSPVKCTLSKCREIYNSFPIKVKEHLKNHWNIVLDVNTNKFIKVIK